MFCPSLSPEEVDSVIETLTDAETIACLSMRTLDVNAATSVLPDHTALLEYAVVPHMKTIALFALFPSRGLVSNPYRVPLEEFMTARAEFYEKIAQMEAELDRTRTLSSGGLASSAGSREFRSPIDAFWRVLHEHKSGLERALQRIGELLLPAELVAQLRTAGIQRLLIVPDGPLYDIPLHDMTLHDMQ